MKNKKKAVLAKRPVLVEKVLLVEGVTRAGKFLLGNFLGAIEDVEHPQYCGLLENVTFLVRFGLLDREVARAIIRNTIDNYGYDTMIGRNINFRRDDKSSIYKSPKLKEYLRRSRGGDGDAIVKRFLERPRYFPHIVHEVFPNIAIFFEMYPNLKVIRMERNPVDLAYSWFKRGWGARWGRDLKSFTIAIKGQRGPIPWFAHDWAKVYENSSEMDRVIRSLDCLSRMSHEVYRNLSASDKKKVHFLKYEDLLTNPDRETKRIASFLKKKILPSIKSVKKRERLPAQDPSTARNEKLAFIERCSTKECLKILMKLEREYSKGGI